MIVSEITGAFTIPYGISIGVRFWSIINETGLWTIPFALAMCTAFVKARQGGEDEGSPALMAFKLVEKAFISMFLVMFLFVLPVDKKEPVEIEYKQYSCRGNYASVLGRSANSTNVQPNLPQSLSIQEPVLPIGWGVLHEVTTGLTQTTIAKIPCDGGINQVQNLMGTVDLSAKDIKLYHSNTEFGKKCYEPAATKLSTAINTKKYNDGLPLMSEQKYFLVKNLSQLTQEA